MITVRVVPFRRHIKYKVFRGGLFAFGPVRDERKSGRNPRLTQVGPTSTNDPASFGGLIKRKVTCHDLETVVKRFTSSTVSRELLSLPFDHFRGFPCRKLFSITKVFYFRPIDIGERRRTVQESFVSVTSTKPRRSHRSLS